MDREIDQNMLDAANCVKVSALHKSLKDGRKRNTRWRDMSDDHKKEWIRYYLSGVALTRIYEMSGIGGATLRGWMIEYGMDHLWNRPLTFRKARMNDPVLTLKVIEAYARGVTLTQMSARLKASYSTIYKILRKNNVDLRQDKATPDAT